jgi:hypothetical protein
MVREEKIAISGTHYSNVIGKPERSFFEPTKEAGEPACSHSANLKVVYRKEVPHEEHKLADVA